MRANLFTIRRALLAGALLLGGCGEAAQQFRAWMQQFEQPRTAATQPAEQPTTRPAEDGDDELAGLLLDRPRVPVTTARGEEPKPPPAPTGPAPVNGSVVVDRRCTLTRERPGGWWELHFEPEEDSPDLPALRVLPNLLLEELADRHESDPDTAYRVTGEVHVHERAGYILLRRATVLAKEAPSAPSPPAETQAAVDAATQPAATRPAEGTAEDVMARLLADRPDMPVVTARPAAQGPADAPSVAPTRNESTLTSGRSGLVVDRLVYVLPKDTGKLWVARFASDNTLREPPLRLMPCLKLQQTQAAVRANRNKQIQWRVTGEVTQYRGKRYLLIRKILPEREMGQF